MPRKTEPVKNEYGRPPLVWLYNFSLFLARIYSKFKFNTKYHVDPAIFDLPRPIVVISNHPSYFDPFSVAIAIQPLKINFLAAATYFKMPGLRWLFKSVGAIPKLQFRPDPPAMKAMLKVIKRNGIVGVFPEGTRTFHGRLMPFEDNFSKFIKKVNANVISVNIEGGYLTWPRWSESGTRKGQLIVNAKVMATADEISLMTTEELHSKVLESLSFDDYAMQETNPVIFKTKKPALGLHKILHKCPKCNAEWSMQSDASRIYCTKCQNTGIMDQYGIINPATENDIIYRHVYDWNKWQAECMDKLVSEIKDNSQVIVSDHVRVMKSYKEDSYEDIGEGTLSITLKYFEYKPDDSNKPSVLFNVASIWGISSDYGLYFDLFGEKESYRFYPENGQKCISYSYALDAVKKSL